MPRMVPSAACAAIARMHPGVDAETPLQQGAVFPMGRHLLRAVADLIDQVPEELLVLAGDDYALFVSARSVIRQSAETGLQFTGQGAGNAVINVLPGSRFSPIRDVRDCLSKCPDQAPSASTAGLAYVNDVQLRDVLRNDISSATSSLANHEYKQATVIAGSVIEALLLWALAELGDAEMRTRCAANGTELPRGQINRWDLDGFIGVAYACDLLQASTKAQAALAKDFRNLIHPGRAQRLGAVCSLGTAYAALAAVDMVSADLERWRAGGAQRDRA